MIQILVDQKIIKITLTSIFINESNTFIEQLL